MTHGKPPTARTGSASLPMYPFDGWRDATEHLWERTRTTMPDLPALAPWGADVHELWCAADLVVSQACGWPLVTELAGRVRVVGAFRYRTPEWRGARYRSAIVARDTVTIGELSGTRAAVNAPDSLSGWVSLLWAANAASAQAPACTWDGPTVWTGAHLESVRAVRDGDADIASIDAVTFAHVRRDRPDLLHRLRVIANGPLVPTLPVITSVDADDRFVERLRDAIAAAIDGVARERLFIEGFEPLDQDDYAGVRTLVPAA